MENIPAIISALGVIITAWFSYNQYTKNKKTDLKIEQFHNQQNDQQGKYVMVAVTENNKMVARKKRINVGQLYEDRLEVKAGLDKGDQLIIQGFENLYDGQLISKSEG